MTDYLDLSLSVCPCAMTDVVRCLLFNIYLVLAISLLHMDKSLFCSSEMPFLGNKCLISSVAVSTRVSHLVSSCNDGKHHRSQTSVIIEAVADLSVTTFSGTSS